MITFDEMTCTESGCDYIKFYKDSGHSDVWGEAQYTGGKDGGSCNWPSIKGRPPLVIPADKFVLFFRTDGSVNCWGY